MRPSTGVSADNAAGMEKSGQVMAEPIAADTLPGPDKEDAGSTMLVSAAPPSSWLLFNVLANVTAAQIVNSFATGVLTVAIPEVARDVGLPPNLVYWSHAGRKPSTH